MSKKLDLEGDFLAENYEGLHRMLVEWTPFVSVLLELRPFKTYIWHI